jgi:type II secretory pathway pseudopilin PulG
MIRQRGFTLIEALVGGIISLVIPATLIVVMTISNRQIGNGAAQMRLSQISTAVSETFHRAGLNATSVYNEMEAVGTKCPVGKPASHLNLTGIIFCAANGDIQAGFRAATTIGDRAKLEEYIPGANPIWKPMVFSGDTVKVNLNPSGKGYTQKWGDLFGVDTMASFAWTNFRLDMEVGGGRQSLPLQTQSIVCRNAPSKLVSSGW